MSSRATTSGWVRDSSVSFLNGQNASRNASDIDRLSLAKMVNCTVRRGPIKPRPAWIRRPLTYVSSTAAETFQRGRFQHGAFFDGNGIPVLLSSHSGRLFRIDVSNWSLTEITPVKPLTTTTTADFTVPAVGASVSVQVTDTSKMFIDLPTMTIGGYPFTLVSIDSPTQITVRNDTGQAVVTTTANFTVPAVGHTVAVSVTDTTNLHIPNQVLTIGGKTLCIVRVNSPTQITVSNDSAAQVGNVVVSGATVVVASSGTPIGINIAHPATVSFYFYDANSPDLTIGWSAQAAKWWVFQDNQSLPVIYNGSAARRSNQARAEVPIGNVMTYAAARLAVALPDRTSYRVGDLAGDPSGTSQNNYEDAILRFTANSYLNEGGDLTVRVFGAPANIGYITAMKAFAMPDTQLGQGPLFVGCQNGVFTAQLPFDRTTWKNLSQPLQTTTPIKGPMGQENTLLVNADMWYRSPDDTIRSYIQAQRQFVSYGNTGQSTELGDLLSFDSQFLLENGSAVLFDNRLLMTVSPVLTSRGVYHRGLAVLNFDLVSNIRGKLPPAWEGIWTGLQILQIITGMVNGSERCFIYALNSNNHIELWELTKSGKFDDGTNDINWNFDLPSYNCGDADQFKKLMAGRFVVQNLTGTLTWAVKYRTDTSPCYQAWDNDSLCAPSQDCGPFQCAGPQTFQPQERTPVKLREPPDGFDTVSNQKYRTGYEFQPRMELAGYGEIPQFRIYAADEPELVGPERTRT